MAYQTLTFAIEEPLARLTLNRPDRLNSFSNAMHVELRDVLTELETSTTARCLLVTGAGRAFCAGADLSQRQPTDGGTRPDLGRSIEENYNPLIRRLRALAIPTIAAVNGLAAGAGMSLALTCDIVIAARSAYFLQAFCNIGLIPDAGSTYFLPRLIGSARAAGMTMLGEKLPAETAAAWGLIWKCVDDDRLMMEAEALAKRLAAGPTKTLALIKDTLNRSLSNDLDAQLAAERDAQREAGLSDDFAEGVRAFLEKRPARFSGR